MPALAEPPASFRPSRSPSATPSCETPGAEPVDLLEKILHEYLTLEIPLTSLALRHGLSFDALCDLIESERFQRLLARLNNLAARRAQDVALHTRAGAISALVDVVTAADKPETARKAASTILRASDPVTSPQRQRGVTSPTSTSSDPPPGASASPPPISPGRNQAVPSPHTLRARATTPTAMP